MYRLGTVARIAQGLLIVEITDRPEIGETVVTEELEEIGRVVDVFGPTDSPYAAITPHGDLHLPELLGTTLYARSQ